MILYRVCKEDEMKSLLEEDYDNIGRYCYDTVVNNHKYELDKKYLHFFDSYSDIFHLNLKEGFYICEYDIPDELLADREGYGVYSDYFKFKKVDHVKEYSIDSSLISKDYLLRSYRIKRYLDIDDYLYNLIEDNIELIYFRNGSKKYEKILR